VSPDGRHVYVASTADSAVAIFARNQGDGRLSFVDTRSGGAAGVEGLQGADAVILSPGGEHAYVASLFDDAVVSFARDPDTGSLAFVERQSCDFDFQLRRCFGVDGLDGPRSLALSGDGRHLYVPSFSTSSFLDDGALAVLARDGQDGTLSFVQALHAGFSGPEVTGASSAAVSPDGRNVYVTASKEATLTVFARNEENGALSFVEQLRDEFGGGDGLFGAQSVVVSPDGRHVFVAASIDSALTVFERDEGSGTLNPIEVQREGVAGVRGLQSAQWATVSPDGRNVYVASSSTGSAVAVFALND
jgi:6-phosphogluconolactonase (cycloisomerase 2 family)